MSGINCQLIMCIIVVLKKIMNTIDNLLVRAGYTDIDT